ncbi:MAG: acyl carrier protein [Lachnospiraceae bacterium]|nr:acyl carrier protein [Lachnospiraceae bacterium]
MLEKIKDILVEHVDIPKEEICLETDLLHDLGLSSLDMVNIIVAFEDEFEIEIPDRKLSEIITVEDVVMLLSKEYGIE